MPITDPYYKKTTTYKHLAKTLQFKLSQSLFSSQTIDHGTQRLLRTFIFQKINKYNKVLDLGCGVGPIGITLKSAYPKAEIHMVDRDALALEYSKANAKLNNLEEGLKVYGSLGYDSVIDTDFDLIVSNIPAKIGEVALSHIIKDANNHLTKEGRVVIVVVDAINDFIKQTLESDENIEITYHHSWPSHHVYHYKFLSQEKVGKNKSSDSAFNNGEFNKQENSFEYKGREIILKTSHNLPEFDQLSFDSKRTISYLKKIKGNPENIMVINPGQGYVPLALTRQFRIQNLTLADRDLLALKTTEENLLRYDFDKDSLTISHQVGLKTIDHEVDLIIGMIPEKQNVEVYQMYINQIKDRLKTNGQILLASSSTIISRIQDMISKDKSLNVIYRERHQGRSLLLLKKVK